MLDIPYGVDLHPMFKMLNIMPLTDRIDFRLCCNVYRALHKQMPDYICDMFKPLSDFNGRETRQTTRNDLHVPYKRLEVSRKTISYRGPTLFNKLSPHIRHSKSLTAFKTSYMTDFFNGF